MSKNALHTNMVGRKVRIKTMFADPNHQNGPWAKYAPHAGCVGEVANVYLKDGNPAYDIIFQIPTDNILTGAYAFAFDVA